MMTFITKATTFVIFLTCIAIQTTAQRASTCQTDESVIGYSSIEDLNLDMEEIAMNTTDGEGDYTFMLCPRTTFSTANQPLAPILSNSMFVCGAVGSLEDECIFDQGEEQVVLDTSIMNLNFLGITFQGFSNVSIAAFAPTDSEVFFENCLWTDYVSPIVIDMSFENGAQPAMNLFLTDCEVSDGQGGAVVVNDGGNLDISAFFVSNLETMVVVTTGNTGRTMVSGFSITQSTASSVIFATSGSFTAISSATVSANNDLMDVFVANDNSELRVQSSSIENNQIERPEGSTGWNGIYAENSGVLTVENVMIAGNTNMQYGIAAVIESTATISFVELANNTGLNVSAPVFARNASTATISDVGLLGNDGFTFQIFTLFESTVQLSNTCIIGGSSTAASMFVGEDSEYEVTSNYIENHQTTGCPEGAPRLFQESPGSSCFGGGDCEGTCEVMAEATECSLSAMTQAPVAPTSLPMPSGIPTPSSSPAPSVTSMPASQAPTDLLAPTSAVVPTVSPAPTSAVVPTVTLAPTVQSGLSPTTLPTIASMMPSPSNGATTPSPSTGTSTPSPSEAMTPSPSTGAATPFPSEAENTIMPSMLPPSEPSPTLSGPTPDVARPTQVPPSPTKRPTHVMTYPPIYGPARPTYGKGYNGKGGKGYYYYHPYESYGKKKKHGKKEKHGKKKKHYEEMYHPYGKKKKHGKKKGHYGGSEYYYWPSESDSTYYHGGKGYYWPSESDSRYYHGGKGYYWPSESDSRYFYGGKGYYSLYKEDQTHHGGRGYHSPYRSPPIDRQDGLHRKRGDFTRPGPGGVAKAVKRAAPSPKHSPGLRVRVPVT